MRLVAISPKKSTEDKFDCFSLSNAKVFIGFALLDVVTAGDAFLPRDGGSPFALVFAPMFIKSGTVLWLASLALKILFSLKSDAFDPTKTESKATVVWYFFDLDAFAGQLRCLRSSREAGALDDMMEQLGGRAIGGWLRCLLDE